MQKALTPQWFSDVAQIYKTYEMYPLSERSEQMIRVGDGFVSRNKHLATKLARTCPIKDSGEILDIGCGNGGFLHAFSQLFPKWRLFGCEQQGSRREDIMKLPAAGGFFQGSIDDVDQVFDCISLVYVIEHLFDPITTLRGMRQKLASDGFVFIKTADLRTGPFDLAVADHCHHFTIEMLVHLMEEADFAVTHTFSDWVDKEIGLIAVPTTQSSKSPMPPVSLDQVATIVRDNMRVLASIYEKAASNTTLPLGVLGTAISATWLANQLGEGVVSFFVDEDESRVGKTHMGAPVMRLADAPEHCALCIPFPPHVAEKILRRIQVFRPDIALLA
ncbi:MAG: class I SAM-dependent methyltransferase [Solidesulfovibrio sp.]